ncbi:MAG TPA: hypothetical protein VGD65_05595 [Chryseosolibacter sp.]
MKTLTSFLLLGFFVLCSCNDPSAETQDNTAAIINEVENRAINGQQWRITNFANGNQNQTGLFTGFIFEFDSNNLLTSTNGSENLSGTWAIKDSGANEDGKTEFDNVDFSIFFSNPTPFVNLSGNWDISSLTDSTIELRQSNGSMIRLERI